LIEQIALLGDAVEDRRAQSVRLHDAKTENQSLASKLKGVQIKLSKTKKEAKALETALSVATDDCCKKEALILQQKKQIYDAQDDCKEKEALVECRDKQIQKLNLEIGRMKSLAAEIDRKAEGRDNLEILVAILTTSNESVTGNPF
jgi:chromosome segregation ATPase